MPEIYTLCPERGQPTFEISGETVPPGLLYSKFNPDACSYGLEFVCRMGDPDLLHCIVWKKDQEPGGIFVLRDKSQALCAIIAESSLGYAIGMGYFGEMTANARYGVDIFENMEEPDD